jgi:hypothetical protein
MLFRGWFQCAVSNEGCAYIAVSIDRFVRERHFLTPPSVSMKNYGEKNVKKYADRFGSHGGNKGCGR